MSFATGSVPVGVALCQRAFGPQPYLALRIYYRPGPNRPSQSTLFASLHNRRSIMRSHLHKRAHPRLAQTIHPANFPIVAAHPDELHRSIAGKGRIPSRWAIYEAAGDWRFMRPSGPRRRLPLALSSRFRVSISSAVLPKTAPFAITSFRVPARVKANCKQSYGLAIRARS